MFQRKGTVGHFFHLSVFKHLLRAGTVISILDDIKIKLILFCLQDNTNMKQSRISTVGRFKQNAMMSTKG